MGLYYIAFLDRAGEFSASCHRHQETPELLDIARQTFQSPPRLSRITCNRYGEFHLPTSSAYRPSSGVVLVGKHVPPIAFFVQSDGLPPL